MRHRLGAQAVRHYEALEQGFRRTTHDTTGFQAYADFHLQKHSEAHVQVAEEHRRDHGVIPITTWHLESADGQQQTSEVLEQEHIHATLVFQPTTTRQRHFARECHHQMHPMQQQRRQLAKPSRLNEQKQQLPTLMDDCQ